MGLSQRLLEAGHAVLLVFFWLKLGPECSDQVADVVSGSTV